MKKLAVLIAMLFFGTSLMAQGWTQVGSHAVPPDSLGEGIYSMCSDIHGNIYVGGDFWDDSGAISVYKWDGSVWTELGHGSTALSSNWPVSAIFADTNGNVYSVAAEDASTETVYVAKWNGTSWGQVGTGSAALYAHGGINAITMDKSGNLYAAGAYIDTAGKYYVAKWDGTNWSEVGTGSNALYANGPINTIFIDTFGNLYAAGVFTDSTADSIGNLYVAMWNGTSWSELGAGVTPQYQHNAQIFSILADAAGNVYAAGDFYYSDIFSGYNYVAKWDGASWSELGTSSIFHANGNINQLCTDRYGSIYAGGDFTDTTTILTLPFITSTYTVNPCYVAKWDGSSWSKVGIGSYALNADDWIQTICSDPSGNIYAAGEFTDTSVTYRIVDTTGPIIDTSYLHPRYVAKYYNHPASVVSLEESIAINIYPNPTTTSLTITSPDKISNITINNLLGQRVYAHEYNPSTSVLVDVSGLVMGVYFVKVNGMEVRKFVKK